MTDMSEASQFLIPRGFRFGAAKAGLKKSGRTDFALIVADTPASAAAAFTANRVTAAPLIVDKEHLRTTGGKVRVVAINAGNANCAAGQAGLDAARATCYAAAAASSAAGRKRSFPPRPASSAFRCRRRSSSPRCPHWPPIWARSSTTSSRPRRPS